MKTMLGGGFSAAAAGETAARARRRIGIRFMGSLRATGRRGEVELRLVLAQPLDGLPEVGKGAGLAAGEVASDGAEGRGQHLGPTGGRAVAALAQLRQDELAALIDARR